MEKKFIEITKEQSEKFENTHCVMCTYGRNETKGDCPNCAPHLREDGK